MSSKINGKELSYAVLHNPIFIPDAGQFGPTLSKTTNGMFKGVKMTIEEPWVILEIQNKLGQLVTVPVPLEMFTHTVLVGSL
jgi:hypothetical protein